MASIADVCVVGGGLAGLWAALFAQEQGLSVVLVERERMSYARGIRSVPDIVWTYLEEPVLREWARQFLGASHPSLRGLIREVGSLDVGRGPVAEVSEQCKNVSIAVLDDGEFRSMPAIRVLADSLVDGRQLAARLGYSVAGAEREKNASSLRSVWGRRVTGLEPGNAGIEVLFDNGERCSARWVINAAGAWANDVLGNNLREYSLRLPCLAYPVAEVSGWEPGLMPAAEVGIYRDALRGITITELSPTSRAVWFKPMDVEVPDLFTGRVGLRDQILRALREAFGEMSVSFLVERLEFWLGAATEDELPAFGADGDIPGLFWMTGFADSGIATAMEAAREAVRFIAEGDATRLYRQFTPSRLRAVRNISRMTKNDRTRF